MSEMSDKSTLPTPRLEYGDRIDLLESSYGVLTQGEIAVKAGVKRRTIERDVRKWKTSGRYDEWLDERWHGLLEDPEIQKKLKFIALTRIKIRRMVEKLETRITGTQEITIKKSGMSLEEMISLVPSEQRSTVLNALRAAWDSTHPLRPET